MLVASHRTAGPPRARQGAPKSAFLVAPAIASSCLIVTIAWGDYYGIGLRDPDGIIGRRLVLRLRR